MPITAPSRIIRLLLIDDRKSDFECLIQRMEETERYSAEWTASAEEARVALRRGECDAVLADPRVAGSGFLREAAGFGMPVILLAESEEAEESAWLEGAADCLGRLGLDEARLECSIRYALRQAKARTEAEIACKSQGQLLAGIICSMPIVIGRLDRAGRVIEAEGDGLATRGMAPGRILGKFFAELYPEAADAVAQAIEGEAAGCAIQGRDEENEEWHVEFFAFPDASGISAAVFFGRDITIRKQLERSLLSISDAEQRRIGADLHDGLGQQLTGIACLAAALRDQLTAIQSPHAAQAGRIAAHINAAIDMTRSLVRGLCPVQVENGGLTAALEDFSRQVERLHGLKCRFRQLGPLLLLEPHVALHLYRIAQEAINNVLRHSSADEVGITLGSTDGRPVLAIEDNGHGFDPASLPSTRGLGLRLMDYRAAMIGGAFRVSRRAEGGMRIECAFSRPLS